MSVFWFAKTGDKEGQYAIGLGNTEVVHIDAPDDTTAAQWAQCCAAALNARERQLKRDAANAGVKSFVHSLVRDHD